MIKIFTALVMEKLQEIIFTTERQMTTVYTSISTSQLAEQHFVHLVPDVFARWPQGVFKARKVDVQQST